MPFRDTKLAVFEGQEGRSAQRSFSTGSTTERPIATRFDQKWSWFGHDLGYGSPLVVLYQQWSYFPV